MIYAVNKRTKEHRIVPRLDVYSNHDWRYAVADADGWIEWRGGECPLPDGAKCEYRMRDGDEDTAMVFALRWTRWGDDSEIIAYRPILDTKPGGVSRTPIMDSYRDAQDPEPPAWDGEGLPPVGCECEFEYCEVGAWVNAKVIGYDGPACVVALDGFGYFGSDRPGDFRPLRSAEDRAVEEMQRITADAGSVEGGFRALYRAGYRKTATADVEDA